MIQKGEGRAVETIVCCTHLILLKNGPHVKNLRRRVEGLQRAVCGCGGCWDCQSSRRRRFWGWPVGGVYGVGVGGGVCSCVVPLLPPSSGLLLCCSGDAASIFRCMDWQVAEWNGEAGSVVCGGGVWVWGASVTCLCFSM